METNDDLVPTDLRPLGLLEEPDDQSQESNQSQTIDMAAKGDQPSPFRRPTQAPPPSKPGQPAPILPEAPVTPASPVRPTDTVPQPANPTRPSPFAPVRPADTVPQPANPTRPSPFAPVRPADTAPQPTSPERPTDKPAAPAAKPQDKAPPVARSAEEKPLAALVIPPAAMDANARAMRALGEIPPGQFLSPALRARFEQALRDASLINATTIAEQDKKLSEDLAQRSRTLPGGRVLPPWTEQKEREFFEKLGAFQTAFDAMPAATRVKIAELEAALRQLPPAEGLRRGQLAAAIRAEAQPNKDSGGKVATYLARKEEMATFKTANAAGLERRNLHQQDMALLHSRAMVSGLYALALEQAGAPADRAKLEGLIKDAASDAFTLNSMPEIAMLQEKYGIIAREALDDKVPGREALKRALSTMNDQTQGNLRTRMEKAAEFFEQAIGAADQIDMVKTSEELEKVTKELIDLGEDGDAAKIAALSKQATELLEKYKQPGLARMAYAMALHSAGVELKDEELTRRALNTLAAIEVKDPGAKYDPLVQGALKLAGAKPPKAFTEEEALEAGKPEAERREREDREAGKKEPVPLWRSVLTIGSDVVIGTVGMYALVALFRAGKNGAYRSMQTWWRNKWVEIEAAPSLPAGEKPRLVLRDASGKEWEVKGVGKEDGRLRLKDGEKIEAVRKVRGDKLVLKVAQDSNLTPEQLREAAAEILRPTRLEDRSSQYQEQLRQRELELETMRQALAQNRGTGPAPETARLGTGAEVRYNGEAHKVAGEYGSATILHRGNSSAAAAAEPITELDLKAKFEEVKVTVNDKQELRFIEKAHPERGLFQVTDAAGQRFIAPDTALSVVPAEQMRASSTTPAPATETAHASGTGNRAASAAPPATPVERPAPERGQAPTAERLTGTEVVARSDGTIAREEVRVGEMSLERMREQREVSAEQIKGLEAEVARLKSSNKPKEQSRGAELEITVRALKGEYGSTAKLDAHRAILDHTRSDLATRGRSVGLAVGIGILTTAALAWYLHEQRRPQSPIQRARVGGN